MAGVLVQLVIEHVSELKLMVYKQAVSSDGWIHFSIVPRLYFELQPVSDDEIFLHVYTMDRDISLNFNQNDAFFFLEKILELGGYYTLSGIMRPHDMRGKYCIERYIDMGDKLQELLDIREKILFWCSYGNIGGDFNAINS